jgi:hypothetical protein
VAPVALSGAILLGVVQRKAKNTLGRRLLLLAHIIAWGIYGIDFGREKKAEDQEQTIRVFDHLEHELPPSLPIIARETTLLRNSQDCRQRGKGRCKTMRGGRVMVSQRRIPWKLLGRQDVRFLLNSTATTFPKASSFPL